MTLLEPTLFGEYDKVAIAIERLRLHEPDALAMQPQGYWVAFSGGKDSIVLLDLVRKSGVRHHAAMNLTTVDPPELLRFVRLYYPDVVRIRPPLSMFQLIEREKMPPTGRIRYCCRALKEHSGKGWFLATGIRWAESARRGKRHMIERCHRRPRQRYIHPILDWSDEDVWEYIHRENLPYCSLYDEGFTRIGCVGCPMASLDKRRSDFERWPQFRRAYLRAFDGIAPKMRGDWRDGESVMAWWLSGKNAAEYAEDDMPFFE